MKIFFCALLVISLNKICVDNTANTITVAANCAASAIELSFTHISGIATAAQIPNLDTAKLTTGNLDVARLPTTGINASTITTGSFQSNQLPLIPGANIYGTISDAIIPYLQITGAPTVVTTLPYTNITGTPTIPSPITSLPYSNITGIPTPITSFPYQNLTDKPNIPVATTSLPWTNISGIPVLFNGDYNALVNKPELFDGNYSSLKEVPNNDELIILGFLFGINVLGWIGLLICLWRNKSGGKYEASSL